MSSAAPQGFRRTVVLKSSLAERSSRDPALTNRPPNPGKSDLLAGTPGVDDYYTIDLNYVGECGAPTTNDIKVYLGDLEPGTLGGCTLHRLDYYFAVGNPLLARRFSLVQDIAVTPFEVILNEDVPWYCDHPATLVFLDDFESGDTSACDSVFP